jgi:hypothetical protein
MDVLEARGEAEKIDEVLEWYEGECVRVLPVE